MSFSESPDFRQGEGDQLRAQVKAHLRKQSRAIRAQLPMAARQQRSLAISERLFESEVFQNARSVAAFVAIRSEVHTRSIIDTAYSLGKKVALPRVCFDTDRLYLHWVNPDDELPVNRWDIPEPSAESLAAKDIDLILVPGLAADERGHRIGYGRGFYDRLLSDHPGASTCFLGYDFQLVAEVPNEATDLPVDWIITDARTIACPARS